MNTPLPRLALALTLALAGCASDAPAPIDAADTVSLDDATDPADATDPGDAADTTPPDDLAPPPHQRELAPAASGPLSAGVATLALDPPVGISMAGYGARTAGISSPWAGLFGASEGAHGALWLKAIALEVAGDRLVLLKAPLVFSEDTLTRAMHADLEARHGLDLRGRVIVGATHTHHGPARFWRVPDLFGAAGIDTADPEVITRIAARMADAVALAVADLAPAEWGYTTLVDWDPDDHVYRDRRSVNAPRWGKDPRLMVFAVRRPSGPPLAVLANFAMHGTILGPSNALLSDDAAGGFEQQLEELLFARYGVPVVGLFMQAGGGDAAPAGSFLGHKDEQRAQMVGVAGAPVVAAALDDLTYTATAELAVRSRVIELRHDLIYGDSGEFDERPGAPYTYGTLTCTIDPASNLSQPGEPKRCVSIAGLLTALGVPLPNADVNQTWLTVARLGPLYLLTLPGEPTHSIVEYARDQFAALAPDADVMVIGYSQDHLLYLTHPDDWYLGAYEAEFSIWGPWAGRYLVDRQLELVADLRDGFNAPVFYEERPSLHPPLVVDAPRPLERSTSAGVVQEEPPLVAARLDVVHVTVGGGDPALGTPVFTIERAEPDAGDAFVPVPDPAGHADRALDSSHPETLTFYRPNPPSGRELLAERDHRWQLAWQLTPTTPAGTYRVVARGRALSAGATPTDWEVTSRPFEVVQDPGAELTATRLGEAADAPLAVTLTHPPAPLVKDPRNAWPLSGWRVHDPGVHASARVRVQAPLHVSLVVDGAAQGSPVEATWDATAGHHVVALPGAAGAVTVRTWLAADRTPAPLDAQVTDPPGP